VPAPGKLLGGAAGRDILPATGGGTVTARKRSKGADRAHKRPTARAGAKPEAAAAAEAQPSRGVSEPAPAPGPPAAGPAAKNAEALEWDARGRHARARGEIALALQCFERALAIDPRNPLIHNNVGNAFMALAQAEQAERHYRIALRLDPRFALAWNNLGMALAYQDRDLEEAVACLRRAVALDPANGDAWYRLGMALRRNREPAGALAALEEALSRQPGTGLVRLQMGLAELALGHESRALECLRRARDELRGDAFVEAEIASIEAAARARDLPGDAKRVAVHINQRFHYAILRALFGALAARHRTIFTSDARRLADFDPDVVIVADAQSDALRRFLPRAEFVFTRHGLISKNMSYAAARTSDYTCVTSEESRLSYLANGGAPRKGFWITGYVQMDPLFREKPLPIPFALPPANKTVLYAPTFNDLLSSAPMLGPRTVELIRGARRDISIVIKPHPHICGQRLEWMDGWRAAAAREPDVFLVEDPAADLVPYLKAADLLVSDASSAALMYLALDRPIVLITNPNAAKDTARYDPNGPEWAWRDMGEEVFDVMELAAAVARGLDDPADRRERRLHYRRLLFGILTDGRAAERIVAHVSALQPRRRP